MAARSDHHLLTWGLFAGAAVLAYINRTAIEQDIANLSAPGGLLNPMPPGTVTTTATDTSTLTPAPTPVTPVIVAPANLSPTDLATAFTNALATSGYQTAPLNSSPGVPLNSVPQPVQTPYGTVIPSSGAPIHPATSLIPGPTVTPTGGQTFTPAPINRGPFTRADIVNALATFAHNFYDLQAATNNPNPNNPASAIPSYRNNVINADNQLNYWYSLNPSLFAGLKLAPWR